MKKGIISLIILTIIMVPAIAGAVEIKIENPLVGEDGVGPKTVPDLLVKITNFIWKMALAVAPILIIIAGYLFLTSAGDPEKVKTAKNTIVWTFVGLLVIFLSQALVTWLRAEVGI